MSLLSEFRARLTATDAELEQLRKQPGDGAALDEAAGKLSMLRAKRELLSGQIAELEAIERAKENEKNARAAAREREQAEAALRERRDALSAAWRVWGGKMTDMDAELRRCWGQYHELARAALALDSDARKAGVELPGPDTSPAQAVMADISSGRSPVKDWHRQ